MNVLFSPFFSAVSRLIFLPILRSIDTKRNVNKFIYQIVIVISVSSKGEKNNEEITKNN